MENFFRNENYSTHPVYLNISFREIRDTLLRSLPQIRYDTNTIATICHTNLHLNDFLNLCGTLERLFFIDKPTDIHTVNWGCYKDAYYNNTLDNILEMNPKTGFVIFRNHATDYQEREGITHLEAAENQFKITPTHCLKIYTLQNLFVVYTNKELPLEAIVKLKQLQWSIFKDKFETDQPTVHTFFNTLDKKEPDEMNKAANDIINIPQLLDMKYENFKELFKPNFTRRIEKEQQRIRDYENDCRQYHAMLLDRIEQIKRIEEEILILKEKNKDDYDATPIIKYLRKHPYIKNFEKIDDKRISLLYHAPLVYFNPDHINRIIHNYSGEAENILKAIKDNKYELMTRCRINFNTHNFNISIERIGWLTNGIMGHPHIDEFSCFGNHGMLLDEPARAGDYIGAIEQISQAVLNINFLDSCVVDRMLSNMTYRKEYVTWRNKETGEIVDTYTVLEDYNEET